LGSQRRGSATSSVRSYLTSTSLISFFACSSTSVPGHTAREPVSRRRQRETAQASRLCSGPAPASTQAPPRRSSVFICRCSACQAPSACHIQSQTGAAGPSARRPPQRRQHCRMHTHRMHTHRMRTDNRPWRGRTFLVEGHQALGDRLPDGCAAHTGVSSAAAHSNARPMCTVLAFLTTKEPEISKHGNKSAHTWPWDQHRRLRMYGHAF